MSFKLDKPATFSVDGYKRNSKDVNNKQNIIASGDITMEDVDFPVHGVDNLGNEKIMEPGKDYSFPGDIVLETPLTKKEMPNFDEGTNKFKMGGFPMIEGTKSHLKQKSDFDKAFADARKAGEKTFEFTGSDGKTRLYNTAYEGEGTVVDTSSITGKSSIGVQGKSGDQQVLYPGPGGHVAPWAREEMSNDALTNVLDIHDVDTGKYEGTQEDMKKRVAEDYSGKNK
mgnify:FL=1|tara:strand:- start:347 stop:1027 length:681 start_codon:yes stop_codon:yes gene_type:complete